MKNQIYSFLICITSCFSCTDRDSFKTVSILENQSLRDATLKFFKSGIETEVRRLLSLKRSSNEIYTDQNDGKGPGEDFLDIIAGLKFDSLIIEFDEGTKLIHYGEQVAGDNPDAITFSQARNFFNEENWILENLSKRKRRVEYEFTYTITQADFLRAK